MIIVSQFNLSLLFLKVYFFNFKINDTLAVILYNIYFKMNKRLIKTELM